MSILYEATGGGGHEMIPWDQSNPDDDITTLAALQDGNEDKVINAYTAKRWANVDVISLTAVAPQGTDTIGDWEPSPTWKQSGASREGWLWAKALYGVLSDDTIEITPIFDIANSEVVSLYAFRIDDNISGYNAVVPKTGDNPALQRWYEKTSSGYVLTGDTTVQSGKTYYENVLGGAVAFKFNSTVLSAAGVKVGLNLKQQRINVIELNPLDAGTVTS